MSGIGGYNSYHYQQLEDLAERLDWTGRGTPEHEAAMKDYLEMLHALAGRRTEQEPWEATPNYKWNRPAGTAKEKRKKSRSRTRTAGRARAHSGARAA